MLALAGQWELLVAWPRSFQLYSREGLEMDPAEIGGTGRAPCARSPKARTRFGSRTGRGIAILGGYTIVQALSAQAHTARQSIDQESVSRNMSPTRQI